MQLFRLAETPNKGVSCGEAGLFVGDVALLEPVGIAETSVEWRPRPLDDINRELSRLYGFEVDAVSKLHGLASKGRLSASV